MAFDGAWGAYPYLPSGNILVTDRQEGLFVLSTNYPRASFFTAFVKDSVTGTPIVNANIDMLNSDIGGTSNIFGNFRDGQRDSGVYQVVVTKPGYRTDTISVSMTPGQTAARTIALLPLDFSIDESLTDPLKVYPNPTNGAFTLEIANSGNQEILLEAYSVTGRKVYSELVQMAAGKASCSPGLNKGVYIFQVSSMDFHSGFRLIID